MAGGTFRWVKPDIYPLLITMVAACGAAAYATTRNFWTNPDVHLSKESRMAGEPTENQVRRAEGYKANVFRSAHGMRTKDGKTDTSIF